MAILGGLCLLVSLVCWIIILIHAFQSSVGMGLLCLCTPVVIWYAFAKFEHEKKGLIIGGWLGGGILGQILRMAGGG